MEKLIDLHVHTTASDGIFTPTEVVKKAKNLCLSAIGIADHDTIGGVKEAMTAGKKFGLEVVPGVEITSYWGEQNKREFHILGYCFDLKSKLLNSTLDHYQQVREARARKVVERFQNLGFMITYERVKQLAKGAIGRPHLARAVLENKKNKKLLTQTFGKTPDFQEFFQAYLVPSKPAYVEKAGIEPEETIKLIHKCKGIAILAHLGWDLTISEEETVKQFVDWSVDGLETIHGRETKEETLECIDYFSSLAKKYDLLITGGSDFHLEEKGKPGLGLLNWNIKIPYELLEKLKKKAKIKLS